MAITVTKISNSATPYSIKYTATGTDNEPAAVTIPRAILLADLVDGPLKQFLTQIADLDWLQVNVDGSLGEKIRIYEVASSIADATELRAAVFRIQWVSAPAPGLSVYMQAVLEARTGRRTFEIRYNYSATV
jgi:hypothetical protein